MAGFTIPREARWHDGIAGNVSIINGAGRHRSIVRLLTIRNLRNRMREAAAEAGGQARKIA